MRNELVIVTRSVHKLREVRAILGDLPNTELLGLKAFPDYKYFETSGLNFEENALYKALHAARELGRLCLADDSGLVVPALNGEPGVHSARYAGLQASDREHRLKLLRKMDGLSDDQRYAYFVCAIAICTAEGELFVEQGRCEGRILNEEKGSNGHGYDSLFVKHDYSRTFAELDEETKRRISPRRKALDKLRLRLEALLMKAKAADCVM